MTHKRALEIVSRTPRPNRICVATTTTRSKGWLRRRLADASTSVEVFCFGDATLGKRFDVVLIVDEDELPILFNQWIKESVYTRLVLDGLLVR